MSDINKQQVSLSAEQLNEFFELADKIGHDREALSAGEMLTSFLLVPDLETGRGLVCRANQLEREKRQETFFDGIAYRSRIGQGKHDRGEAAIFANEIPPESDLHGHSNHFPVHLKAVSVLEKVIPENEQWDVSLRGDAWGMNDAEEVYVLLNVGHLRLEKNSSLIVRGNVFSLCCQYLSKAISDGSDNWDIGILPTPFSQDNRQGQHNGSHGLPGKNGENGHNGESLVIQNSLLGPLLAGPLNERKADAGHGWPGAAGGDGEPGRNGGPSKLAEITIRQLEQKINVFCQAGNGGDGGDGGDGGNGGDGGKGGRGGKTLMHFFPDGSDGNAGYGGDGGNGGNGGNGGIASNIYISVPHAMESFIQVRAPAGIGGKAGTGGKGGKSGNIKNNHHPALDGKTGKNGRDGKQRPAPVIFINQIKQ